MSSPHAQRPTPQPPDAPAAGHAAQGQAAHGGTQRPGTRLLTAWPRSLQGRLLVLVLALVAGVWLGTAVMAWRDVRHELDELLDGHLAQAAALLVVQQAAGELEDDAELHLPTLHRQTPKVAFQVFHDGRLGVHSANAPDQPMSGTATPGGPTGLRNVHIGAQDWRVFSARSDDGDTWVYVGELLASRADILHAVLRSTLAPLALTLPLLALLIGWAIHRGLAPLRGLGRQLAQRRPQALDPVVVDGAPSEMKPMIDALNGLFGRIEGLMSAERRFTADASHELRTPVAAIRAQAQAALGATDDAQRRHALAATVAGCDRAIRVVEQLLTLSRLEAEAAPAHGRVELGALVRGVLAELGPVADGRGQTLTLDAPAPCPVRGDATLLSVLVRNLADNASRYSPAGAQVQVAVANGPDGVCLAVEDSGPGLSEADQARLGERFFRVLGSGQAGSGLGWSIVRRIAQVHGATVTVGRSEGLGGLAVTVRWPAAGH